MEAAGFSAEIEDIFPDEKTLHEKPGLKVPRDTPLALLPDAVGIQVSCATVLLRLGRWEQGLAELRDAVRREPDNVRWKAVLDDALNQAPAEFGGKGLPGKSQKAATRY